MFKIYPYKVGSASVKKLKEVLNAVIIKTEGSRYRYKDSDLVINWGNSRRSNVLEGVPVLNDPEAVAVASNKLLTLQRLLEEGVSHVPFTADIATARRWLADGNKVFVRNSLTGHSGAGIEVLTNGEVDSLHNARLFTQGVQNHGEYRVHVFDGEVILYQKKSRRVDEDGNVVNEGVDHDVRNLASNWIYRTGNLNRLERIEDLAIQAVASLGLDFGAVDIIKDQDGQVYVLEVNTAPGLGNKDTLDAYVEAFNSLNN